MIKQAALIVLGLLFSTSAYSHDQWANGTPVPEWVKSKCCNASEAKNLSKDFGVTVADITTHKLPSAATGTEVTVYHIKGFLPDTYSLGVYPSQDGDIWVFSDKDNPKEALHFWCMFLPCAPKNDAAPADFGGECS